VRKALSLASLLLFACSGTKVQGVLARAPSGEQVLAREKGTLQLFDLPSRKSVWQAVLPDWNEYRDYYAIFSTGGRYFVLGEQQRTSPVRTLYSVWESASGRRVSPYYEHPNGRLSYAGGLAVSDDGRWLATDRGNDQGQLQLIEVRTQRVSFEIGPQSFSPIQFSPDSQFLAIPSELFRLDGEGWRSIGKFPGGFSSVWVGMRLAVATPNGVDIWDGGKVSQHIDYPFKFVHDQQMSPEFNVYLRASDSLLAVCEKAEDPYLTLYDVARGAKPVERRGLGSLAGLTFRGDTAFWLTFRDKFDTFVTVFDVRAGKVVREVGFGAYASGGPVASPHNTYFLPHLLEHGHYLELFDEGDLSSRFKPIEH